MNIDLMDREGTMIQATFFNDNAIKWYDKVHENKCYVFANGRVAMANKRFTSIKNDFCLTLGNETEIEEAAEDNYIMSNGFSFTTFDKISVTPAAATIDVIGVIFEVGQIGSIKMKNGENREKLNLVLADDSGYSVPVTIWGDACRSVEKVALGSIIAFKACRVSEYSGKTLNASSDAQDIFLNVQHPR